MKNTNAPMSHVGWLVLFLVGAAYTVAWMGRPSLAEEPADIEDPNRPCLVGVWDVTVEFYGGSTSEPSEYGAGSFLLEVTEQTGQVFTGHFYNIEDANALEPVNGALVGDRLRIGGLGFTLDGVLDPNETMFSAVYNNMPIEQYDEDFETGAISAQLRLQ